MNTDFMHVLREKARSSLQRIVFPEGGEAKIIKAASEIQEAGIAQPILIGEKSDIQKKAQRLGINSFGIEIEEQSTEVLQQLAIQFAKENPIYPEKVAERLLKSPLNFAAMMVKVDLADAMVAGLSYPTSEIIMSSQMFIGLEPGIETISSLFLMSIPGYKGSEGNLIVFADCGSCPEPTEEELADIAIETADTVQAMLGWEPRIAMLSFSTKGSADHPLVDHVTNALSIVRERRPDLKVDGEFQVDAAIVPTVAAKKVNGVSDVAGKANILIFPDLNAGNIGYKLVQRFANADAYGPFLQGFAKTVSDLSRGSSVEDIIGVTTMAAVRAQNMQQR